MLSYHMPAPLLCGERLLDDERVTERAAAGYRLAAMLRDYRGGAGVVLALSPGGVAVAATVARGLRLPLDMLIARTFVVKQAPFVVAGALSEQGGLYFNAAVMRVAELTTAELWRAAFRAQREVQHLAGVYRPGRSLPDLARRTIMLVDDGLTDGMIQLAALAAVRQRHPRRCIVATTHGSAEALERVASHADALVALADAPGAHPQLERRWRYSLDDTAAAALLAECRSQEPG
jgi:putative phosphoribosyl transferase